MAIQKMDHFTILTKDWKSTAKFYEDILGFRVGERPNFAFPGCWLHNDGKPVLHVIERPKFPRRQASSIIWPTPRPAWPATSPSSRHATSNTTCGGSPRAATQRGCGRSSSTTPNGAKVELDFAREEAAPVGT